MSVTQRFCYESLTVSSSVPEKSVHCREVSAIKDIHHMEVLLYLNVCITYLVFKNLTESDAMLKKED